MTTTEEIRRLGPWFHNLHLPDGTQTAPDHVLGDFPEFKWRDLEPAFPVRLDGWTVLDIGCNAGFYSLRLAARGADVTGVDCDPHYLRQAEWAAERFGLSNRVRFRRAQVYDLGREGKTYDLVLFMGVFYHLRYPMLALDVVSRLVGKLLVFQTMTAPGDEVLAPPEDLPLEMRSLMRDPGWPRLHFVEHRLMGDPTNWWVPNHAGVLALLRESGMRVLDTPLHETYLCAPDASRPSATRPWSAEQYGAALGDGA